VPISSAHLSSLRSSVLWLFRFRSVCDMPQKSDGVPSEAQRADNGSGVLRVEAASPLPTRKGLTGAL